MSYYRKNKERAIYRNSDESMTDQSQARDTNINVIVKRFTGTATIRGNAAQPMYLDSTQLPQDLRGFIERAESVERLKKRLPDKLKNMSTEEILALTPEQLTSILTPPAPTPATTAATTPTGNNA